LGVYLRPSDRGDEGQGKSPWWRTSFIERFGVRLWFCIWLRRLKYVGNEWFERVDLWRLGNLRGFWLLYFGKFRDVWFVESFNRNIESHAAVSVSGLLVLHLTREEK
jgi:hypothetical protein